VSYFEMCGDGWDHTWDFLNIRASKPALTVTVLGLHISGQKGVKSTLWRRMGSGVIT
jgi:hypothetical protein